MFGDNDMSKAVTADNLFEGLDKFELHSDELWTFTSVRNLFDNIVSDDEFRSAYVELVHYLTRTDEPDINKFIDEPQIASIYGKQRHAMVACAVHPVLRYHGLDLSLRDIGVIHG